MKPLRIVVMTTVPQTLAAFFPRQMRALAEAGFEVHVVSSPGADLDAFNQIPGVTAHAVAMERQPHPLRDLQSLFRLLWLFRRLRPQIVHAHTPKAGLLGMLAARISGVPTRLYTIHGLPLETRTGHYRSLLEAAERASCRFATSCYTISRSLQKVVTDLQLCPPEKVTTLGDGSCAGVNVDRFDIIPNDIRPLLGLAPDDFVVSFVGRVAQDKGIGILAKAWPIIAANLPHAHLLLAGEPDLTDPVPGPLFEALAGHPRVHLLGPVKNTEVPAIYAASDLFVLPSFREGLSQVALEAGAMGLPIVASDVTGLKDAVRQNVTGLLVPPRRAAPLAAAVLELAWNAPRRQALGVAARQYIRESFSDRRVNQLWMAEYRRLAPQLSSLNTVTNAVDSPAV